jgi:hypothetical protein
MESGNTSDKGDLAPRTGSRVRNQQPVTGASKSDLIKNPVPRVELVANQKLELLRGQAEKIMEQANEIFDNVAFTKEIYGYGFRFDPIADQVYYIYERENGERFVSLIAPKEWGKGYTLKHIYSAKFCIDDTWEKVDEEL